VKPLSFLLVCFITTSTFAAEDANTPAPPAEQPPIQYDLVRFVHGGSGYVNVSLYVKPAREQISIRVCFFIRKNGRMIGRFDIAPSKSNRPDLPLRYTAKCTAAEYTAESLMYVTITDDETGKTITTLKLPFKDAVEKGAGKQ